MEIQELRPLPSNELRVAPISNEALFSTPKEINNWFSSTLEDIQNQVPEMNYFNQMRYLSKLLPFPMPAEAQKRLVNEAKDLNKNTSTSAEHALVLINLRKIFAAAAPYLDSDIETNTDRLHTALQGATEAVKHAHESPTEISLLIYIKTRQAVENQIASELGIAAIHVDMNKYPYLKELDALLTSANINQTDLNSIIEESQNNARASENQLHSYADKRIKLNTLATTDEWQDEVFDMVFEKLTREEILERFQYLPEKWKHIIIKKYGLDGKIPQTDLEMSETLKLTRTRINQIGGKAEEKLRHPDSEFSNLRYALNQLESIEQDDNHRKQELTDAVNTIYDPPTDFIQLTTEPPVTPGKEQIRLEAQKIRLQRKKNRRQADIQRMAAEARAKREEQVRVERETTRQAYEERVRIGAEQRARRRDEEERLAKEKEEEARQKEEEERLRHQESIFDKIRKGIGNYFNS